MQNDKVIGLINSEFKLHPKAQLIDYYKLFFQGTFGPEHIISSKSAASKFLQNELDETSVFEKNNFQDISFINEMYRVNLSVIKKGIVSINDFFEAFIKSLDLKNKISFKEWLDNWKIIEQQIFSMKISIDNRIQQSAELCEIIKTKQLISHSKTYRIKYTPHYRLMNKEEFKRIGL